MFYHYDMDILAVYSDEKFKLYYADKAKAVRSSLAKHGKFIPIYKVSMEANTLKINCGEFSVQIEFPKQLDQDKFSSPCVTSPATVDGTVSLAVAQKVNFFSFKVHII